MSMERSGIRMSALHKLRTKSLVSAAFSPGESLPEKVILRTKTTLQRSDWRFAIAYCNQEGKGNGSQSMQLQKERNRDEGESVWKFSDVKI